MFSLGYLLFCEKLFLERATDRNLSPQISFAKHSDDVAVKVNTVPFQREEFFWAWPNSSEPHNFQAPPQVGLGMIVDLDEILDREQSLSREFFRFFPFCQRIAFGHAVANPKIENHFKIVEIAVPSRL